MLRRWLAALVLAALPVSSAALPTGAAIPDAAREKLLGLLHDGRFDAADRLATELAGERRNDPEASFMRAFVTYWRTIYDPKNPALLGELDQRLVAAIDAAEAAEDRSAGEAALWKGSAHMLRAQLRASQKSIFGAAFEAKRAKKLLEQAVAQGSAPADSDFGLGTYQYYADRLPAIVKGLRAILFIPGGDREMGLERLRRACAESDHFAFESRIVLANIYSDDSERLYDQAQALVDETLKLYPGAIAALHGAARLDLAMYRAEPALERLERALELAARQGDTAPSVVATLRYYAGSAEIQRMRPDLALERWRPILEAPREVPEHLVPRVQRAAGRAFLLLEEPPKWTRAIKAEPFLKPSDDAAELRRLRASAPSFRLALPALEAERAGNPGGSAKTLATLHAEHPDDSLIALIAGRAALHASDAEQALPMLRAAATAADLPDLWKGDARLLAGIAADGAGDRKQALDWYRDAEKQRFDGRDAARLFQQRAP